jgi:iron complex transport system permease protein
MKRAIVLVVLAVLLVAGIALSLGLGAVRVSPISLFAVILKSIGLDWLPAPTERDALIILLLRLPRTIAALLVGSTLAVCGAVMQGMFRNPMASPEILGVSAGGSLGAVIVITTGISGKFLLALPLATVSGAIIASAVIYAVSSLRGTVSLLFIVIAGMAVSSLFNGLTSAFLMFSREHEVGQFVFWTMGGLEGRTWRHAALSAPILVPCMAVLAFFSREINLFALGEQGAASLGVNVERTKRLLLILCAIATGTAISVSGPIGFIGLLIPHLFRLLVGADHRTLIPASALGGALFLMLCDLLGRIIAPPLEIRVGIITAILGSPYLVFLVVRSQLRRGGAK